MLGKTALKYVVGTAIVIFLVAMIAGSILGQPVLISYVETGSMSPTLEPNDGFVAVPTFGESSFEEGDVIVFDAEELHDGGLVTHRVVGETDRGYITQGDANPVTDQDSDEPPVQEGQIKAKALEFGNDVVVIPGLGTPVVFIGESITSIQQTLAITFGTRALLGSQGLAYILIVFGAVTYLLSSLAENSGGRNRERDARRRTGEVSPRSVVVLMTVILLVVLTASMLIPTGPHHFNIVSSESASDRPEVIQQGTNDTATYIVPSNGPIPVVAFVEPASDGVDVDPQQSYIPSRSEQNFSVTIYAPEETGAYVETIREYRYLSVLPTDAIAALHSVHPWAALAAVNLVASLLFVLVSLLFIGADPIRLTRNSRSLSFKVRLRRFLK